MSNMTLKNMLFQTIKILQKCRHANKSDSSNCGDTFELKGDGDAPSKEAHCQKLFVTSLRSRKKLYSVRQCREFASVRP